MRRLLTIVSVAALGSIAAIGVANAQSQRPLPPTSTAADPQNLSDRADWFSNAIDNILSGPEAPASHAQPAQGRPAGR